MRSTFLIISIAMLSFISCGSQHSDFAGYTEAKTTAMKVDMLAESAIHASHAQSEKKELAKRKQGANVSGQEIEKKLIKIGHVSIEVEDYKQARPQILAAIKKYQGYVSNDSEENSSYRTGSSMTIRIPKQNFDTLLQTITSYAQRIESKQVNLKDVTEEFVDIQARLKNKRKVEERYSAILQQAKTIKDILEVEEHLRQIREEIEAKEGRLKYLQSQVSFSTIHLQVYQKFTSSVYQPTFFGQIANALVGGWKGLQTFIIGLIYIWPFLLIFALAFWFIRKWVRNRKAIKNN